MISNTDFWFDITRQVDQWANHNRDRFYTGYGGPHMGNESISAGDFATLKFEWKEYGRTRGLETRTAASGSGMEQDVVDFICHETGEAKKSFVYHIVVPGISTDRRIDWV
jgi:hypothetical protein